jgi:threonine dehydratase
MTTDPVAAKGQGSAKRAASKPDAAAIRAAAARIAPHVRRTPVVEVDGADFGLAGIRLVFKLEFLQHAGSFKTRGAFNSLLSRPIPGAGVVAASGGNHGAAVAYAAMKLGVPATIFVPVVASPAKIAQIRGYGARLEVGGERYADALAASEKFVESSGAAPIHAFDQLPTLEGQGTVGLEIEEQAPQLDALLVAVGGGGLIGGIAAWYAGRTPLVGVEPEAAPTLERALAAGEPVDAPAGGIAADSLAPRRVGSLMFPLAQRYVAASVLVTDEAIVEAQRALWTTLRIVAEPGGAAALAALTSGRYALSPGSTAGVLLCGANTTAVRFD